MNITIIETDDRRTIERIVAFLTHRKFEFITKPGAPGDGGPHSNWTHGTCFVVFCSRTNWELYDIWSRLSQNRENYFEIRGVANASCRGAVKSNLETRYEGRLFNAHGTTDIGEWENTNGRG